MNYEEFLLELMQRDERFVILTAENRSSMRSLPNVVKDRFIDCGIAEQTMIGMSAGLALRGRIPIVHALATFLTLRAFEFIRTDIGIGNLPVKLMGAVPGFFSDANGPTHQSLEDVSIMRGIPGMNVFCPSDEEDLIMGIEKIFPYQSPFYIRYNNLKPEIKHAPFEIGKAEVISEGDIMILTYGLLFKEALAAAEILKADGKPTGVINIRTLKPFDKETIIKYCRKSGLIVTLEDHFLTGGLYSILSEVLTAENINCKVLPIGLETWFKPALLNDVLEYEGFTGKAIAEKIVKVYESSNNLFKYYI
ncbi:MAG: transketolase C-terminal domain-containing protein [Ignavibacteriaceae bacterium]|nr:transketolase C-terminal domain-containing protein [Ignavibacteriaceae bacterium]